MKEPIKEKTGFGKFLQKAGRLVPEVLDVVKAAGRGDIAGVLDEVGDILKKKGKDNKAIAELSEHFELQKMSFAIEEAKVEAADRDSARQREKAYVEANKTDWMQIMTGVAGLGGFSFSLYVVVFLTLPDANRDLFIHILGVLEGVMLSIFTYYYGSKKKSNQ